jgi:hypothetical protein
MKSCKADKCRQKLDLVERFECNLCKKIYCSYHRYYETHSCPNFKQSEQLLSGEMEKFLIMYNMNKIFDKAVKVK